MLLKENFKHWWKNLHLSFWMMAIGLMASPWWWLKLLVMCFCNSHSIQNPTERPVTRKKMNLFWSIKHLAVKTLKTTCVCVGPAKAHEKMYPFSKQNFTGLCDLKFDITVRTLEPWTPDNFCTIFSDQWNGTLLIHKVLILYKTSRPCCVNSQLFSVSPVEILNSSCYICTI